LEKQTLGEDVQVDECTVCHGVWFDGGELSEAKKGEAPDLRWVEFDLWKEEDLFQVSEGALKCPRDHVPMASVKYGPTEVTVDACVKCRGVWLDKGEFEQIIDSLEEYLSSMTQDQYEDAAIQEARDLIGGEKSFISEWRDFRTVLRLLQYRILVENPKVRNALTALQISSPFQ
jgi:Zn-finger nucleic acid-binding protein